MPSSEATVREIQTRAINADLSEPIETASGTLSLAPLIPVDAVASDGVIGSAYVFGVRRQGF